MPLDVYFPLWLQLALPATLVRMFSVNLAINCVVVLVVGYALGLWSTWKAPLLYGLCATFLGLVADFVGLGVVETLVGPVVPGQPYSSGPVVGLAAALILGANYLLGRRFALRRKQAIQLALAMAILTAPWTALLF